MTAVFPTDRRLREAPIEALFAAAGGLLEGHFRLKNGRHTTRYLEKFTVLQYPALGVEICRRLAVALAPHDPTVVVGPTTGGVLLSFETARQLEPMVGHTVRAMFAEPADPEPSLRFPRSDQSGRRLRRGWKLATGERIVLVDDILTTGESLFETLVAVQHARKRALAAAVVIDRSSEPVDLGLPLTALGRIEIPSWPARRCERCAAGDRAVKPGSS
jgi:orotate phosphoribosyltransferase